MSGLSGEIIKLSAIREAARKELQVLLDGIQVGGDKSKVVCLDPSLTDAFRYSGVSDTAFKPEKNVQGVFELQADPLQAPTKSVVFFVRPALGVLKTLAANVENLAVKQGKTNINVVWVPRKTYMCENILEEEYRITAKSHSVTFLEFDFDLIPLDDDVVSMEMPYAFKDSVVDGDVTPLHFIARSILKLQTVYFGAIPTIRAKGRSASRVLDIVHRMMREIGKDFSSEITPEIDALYIVDREVDLITPMMSQLTYEGLIDEMWGISAGHFDPPFDTTNPDQPAEPRAKKIPLNSTDRVFADLRDLNFAAVAGALNKKSLAVRQTYDQRHNLSALKDLKNYMKALPEVQEEHRLVGVHTNVASTIGRSTTKTDFRKSIATEQSIVTGEDEKQVVEYIEDLINRGDPLLKVLRVVSLLSLTNNGIKARTFDTLRDSMMMSYGIPQMIATLHVMEKAGLIRKQESRGNFTNIRKAWRLWIDNLNEKSPDDLAYVYSGYAPLIPRLIECATESPEGWNSGPVEMLPGEKVEMRNDVEVPGNTRVVMVFFVGGVTAAEVSALRFLAAKERDSETTTHFVVATTSVITGNSMIRTLLPIKA